MQAEEIRKTIEVFGTDNGLMEVRVFNTIKGTENYSGIFNNPEDLIREAQKFDRDPYIMYFIFNELKDATEAFPQLNKFIYGAKTIHDTDIKYRRWIMLDFDPIREGGVKDIPSTDEEMERAHLKAVEVYKFLRSRGFPKPVVCLSGNGYHTMFKIDKIPNTQAVDDTFKNFLGYIALRYTDEYVDCDIKNKNAARLTKFYSSVSRKGGNTATRPHRKSEIISIPDKIEYVDFSLVEQIANEFLQIKAPESPNQPTQNRSQGEYNGKKFDIDDFLKTNGIEVYKESLLSDGTRKLVLKTCPFHPEHGKDSAIFVSDKGIVFTCFHQSCAGNDWHKLRLMYDPHAYDRPEYEPRPYQRQQYQPQQRKKYEIKQESPELGKKWFSMSDINKVDLTQLENVKTGIHELDKKIVGLNMSEVTLISGSNSSGKSSWINTLILNVVQQGEKVALWSGELRPDILKTWIQMCAAGRMYLKPSKMDEGKYYVPNEIGHRIDEWLDGKFFLYNNEYSSKWEQIFSDMNLLKELGVKLFILDNLFSLDINSFDGDKNNKQTELILQIKKYAKDNNVHIMLVAHPRKAMSFLRKNDISGTADLTNAVDNVFICHRVNNDFLKAGGEFLGESVIQQYAKYGNCIEVAKNRMYGVVDFMAGMYYEIESRRFKNSPEENIEYGWKLGTGNIYQEIQTSSEVLGNSLDECPF